MSRTCTVCTHPDRPRIDAALLAGTAYRTIAKQFEVSAAALQRHKQDHIPTLMVKAHDAREVTQADELVTQARTLQAKALALLAKAEAEGDFKTALMGVREARGCLELLAKLSGELDERPQINLVTAPEWVQIRTTVLVALAPYPSARIAVVEAIDAS